MLDKQDTCGTKSGLTVDCGRWSCTHRVNSADRDTRAGGLSAKGCISDMWCAARLSTGPTNVVHRETLQSSTLSHNAGLKRLQHTAFCLACGSPVVVMLQGPARGSLILSCFIVLSHSNQFRHHGRVHVRAGTRPPPGGGGGGGRWMHPQCARGHAL